MIDQKKSKQQLIAELTELRQRLAKYEPETAQAEATDESGSVDVAAHPSTALFGAIFQNMPIPIAITSFPEGRFVAINDSFTALSGYAQSDLLGKTSRQISIWLNPLDRDELVRQLSRKQSVRFFESEMHTADGSIKFGIGSSERITLQAEEYIITSFIDITERQQAEAALRQSEEMLRRREKELKTLLENTPDAIMRFNRGGMILYFNPSTLKVLARSPAIPPPYSLDQLNLSAKERRLWQKKLEASFAQRSSLRFESTFTMADSRLLYYHVRLVPETNEAGEVESVLATLRNVTDMKQTELALRASEARNQQLLNHIPDLLFQLTPDGIYLNGYTSRTHLAYTPLEQRIGKHVADILPAEQAAKIIAAIGRTNASGDMQVFEYELPIQDTTYFFEGRTIACNDGTILLIVRDITELTQLKQEITRLDRLNLVGEMAASIGHEVRNPMTTVRGFLQMLSRKQECINFHEYFDLMIEELDRANAIITEFLSLAKNKSVHLEAQQLNTIIKTLAPLIQSDAIMSNKYLKLDLADTPDLLLDAKEIRQLILNLARNGLEAMQPHTLLTIRTRWEHGKVVLAIVDQGCGIPPELIGKLGTPFFTTKENGTGLGLAVCYSIAARHKAAIEVETGPEGTTFLVKFSL